MAIQVIDFMNYIDGLQRYADPRTRNWFLLSGTPVYVWALTATYLTFVFVGKRVMSTRQPFDLRGFMFFYNMGLVALSMYMFVEIIMSAVNAGYGFVCAPYNAETIKDPRELRVARVLWWYFFSKAIEMCDTVLMVLRKKNRQVTFLHVFHHSAMLNIWWFVESFIPGGLSVFGSSLNCFVHVVMYSYYGLSVIPSLKDKLWWKRYITQFQLIQFCMTLSHTLLSMYVKCDFPSWGQYTLAGFMLLMLVLFTNFYIRSYIRRSHSKANGDASKNRDDDDETTDAVTNGNGKAHLNGANNGAKRGGSSPRSKKIK